MTFDKNTNKWLSETNKIIKELNKLYAIWLFQDIEKQLFDFVNSFNYLFYGLSHKDRLRFHRKKNA